MTLDELLLGGGLGLAAVLTLIQIAPVKIDPWSAIAKAPVSYTHLRAHET